MKLYLLLFNDLMGTTKEVTDFLDTRKEVLNWLTAFPHSTLIVSANDLLELTNIINQKYPGIWFLLSQIDGKTTNGFLLPKAWELINSPKSSGRWPGSSSAIAALLSRQSPKPS